jgi:hypothetical protein
MELELAADVSVAWEDWGRPVLHQVVESAYDPATQQTTEVLSARPLRAIVGPIHEESPDGTRGSAVVRLRKFLVLDAGWPVIEAGATQRLVVDDVTYDVVEVMDSDQPGVRRIVGRERGAA